MRSARQLIEDSRDDRLTRLPQYAQILISDLATRLKQAEVAKDCAQERAEKEVDEARALLVSGPEGSDTFMDLPSSLYSTVDDYEQRPLGKGVTIEFRDPGFVPGEGITVKLLESGALLVHGTSRLAVAPVSQDTLHVFERTDGHG